MTEPQPFWSGAFSKDSILPATVLLLIGAIVKYSVDLRLARRKDRLDRANAQLKLLYGPLYAAAEASDAAWAEFKAKFFPDRANFFDATHHGADELATWCRWMIDVSMPINDSIITLLRGNADLLRGSGFPDTFERFVRHAASYKSIMGLWATLPTSNVSWDNLERWYLATEPFPREFLDDVRMYYQAAKNEQEELISAVQHRSKAKNMGRDGRA